MYREQLGTSAFQRILILRLFRSFYATADVIGSLYRGTCGSRKSPATFKKVRCVHATLSRYFEIYMSRQLKLFESMLVF
jgi:hypothetical protein